MREERKRILTMLAEGKITADEAEELISALNENPLVAAPPRASEQKQTPRYLRVLINDGDEASGGRVNVRVPLSLVRAGMRFQGALPGGVGERVSEALRAHGVDVDAMRGKSGDVEEMMQAIYDLNVDIGDGASKVRVYCE